MIYVIYELFSFCNASLKSLFYDGETKILIQDLLYSLLYRRHRYCITDAVHSIKDADTVFQIPHTDTDPDIVGIRQLHETSVLTGSGY